MTLLSLLDFFGVSVFAIHGALAAGNKQLDWVGVLVVASVTAIGGGTLRDLLLDRHPVFWLQNTHYLWIILFSAITTLIYTYYYTVPQRVLQIADTIGLAMCAIGGARVAEDCGFSGIIVVISGVITGVAGGIFRDVLIAEIPLVLKNREVYASAAILGILLYLLLEKMAIAHDIATYMGIAGVLIVRFFTIFWHIQVPFFDLKRKLQ